MSHLRYTGLLRYYIDPSDDIRERADALVDFCEQAHLDGVLLFTASHEKQPWVLSRDETEQYIAAMSQVAAVLRERELIVDVNVITTLGHDDEGVPRGGAPLDFTHMVDATGEESIGIVCRPRCLTKESNPPGLLPHL